MRRSTAEEEEEDGDEVEVEEGAALPLATCHREWGRHILMSEHSECRRHPTLDHKAIALDLWPCHHTHRHMHTLHTSHTCTLAEQCCHIKTKKCPKTALPTDAVRLRGASGSIAWASIALSSSHSSPLLFLPASN